MNESGRDVDDIVAFFFVGGECLGDFPFAEDEFGTGRALVPSDEDVADVFEDGVGQDRCDLAVGAFALAVRSKELAPEALKASHGGLKGPLLQASDFSDVL